MLPRLLLTAAMTPALLMTAATPAFAHAPAGHLAGDPVPAGCVRAYVHVPAGKIAHAPAPIRCGATFQAVPELASMQVQATHPRAPLKAPRTAVD